MALKSWKFLKFWKHVWPDVKKNIFDSDDGYVFPPYDHWFRALALTPFDKVKCVILGQDPYPTKGHANGLAFSVYPHVRPFPRTLCNIFQEYQDDLGFDKPKTGDLTPWATEGVLLLNSILTCEEGKSLSHAGIGWEKLTYEVLRVLAERNDCVFVLWGRRSAEYTAACGKCDIIRTSHPSPLSATKGSDKFFGSRPFSKVNECLIKQGLKPIDWKLP